MSTGTAEEIARAAQDSGQEDDITVFTLTRQPIPDQATDQLVTQALFRPLPELSVILSEGRFPEMEVNR